MGLNIDVLYSENSHGEFVVLWTLPSYNNSVRDVVLDEFRKRAYKRCFKIDSYLKRYLHVALFNPGTEERTQQQIFQVSQIVRQPYCQMMHFKTTWESERIGIEIEDLYAKRLGIKSAQTLEFFSHQEMHEDIGKEREYCEFEKGLDSGYGSKSTGSGSTRKEKRKAESYSDIQTLISGEEVTEQDLLDEVERAVSLRLEVMQGGKPSDGTHGKVQDWLKSSEIRPEIPDILTTEALDRKLGNITEADIGLKGGKISLRSYEIVFPTNSVKTENKFKFRISLETDLLEYPEDLILVCLPLHCSPGNLEFDPPVSLKIPTWIRKADSSPESPPISVYTYQKRKDGEWRCVKSTELNSSGVIEVECDHFCINAAFIKKSDVGRVKFSLEHILFKDKHGVYTSCHFLASDAFVSSMLQYLKDNYEIVHPPTYTSLVREGDEVEIDIVSEEPDSYQFKSKDTRVFKIDKDFYTMNRRESISFLLTPKPVPNPSIEFTYIIGAKKFLKRDEFRPEKRVHERTFERKDSLLSNESTTATGVTGGKLSMTGQASLQTHAETTVNKRNVYNGPITIIVKYVNSQLVLLLAIFVVPLAVLLYHLF